jgi:hypothetical protein
MCENSRIENSPLKKRIQEMQKFIWMPAATSSVEQSLYERFLRRSAIERENANIAAV